MITSFGRVVRRVFAVAVLGGSVLGSVGCGGTSGVLTYARAARDKGLTHYRAHEYENAAGSFRSATRQDPRDYKSFYFLGASYASMGSHQQAAQAFQSSLKVMDLTLEGQKDKEFRAQAVQGLGVALAKGHGQTAEVAMPQAGKRPAEDAWLRATVLRHSGDADGAVEAYTAASLHDPKHFHIAKDHGLYLAELGQTRQADVQLRRAYQLNPSDEQVATALRRTGTIPGPSLKNRDALARPPVPQGPLPEMKMPRFGGGSRQASAPPAPAAAPEGTTVQAPRD